MPGLRVAHAIRWVGLDNYNEFLFLGQAVRDNLNGVGQTLVFCFFIIGAAPGLHFRREHDVESGYPELVIDRIDPA